MLCACQSWWAIPHILILTMKDAICFGRQSAEEAIGSLNGTVIGKNTVRLSWGRSPNKQVQESVCFILMGIFYAFLQVWSRSNLVLVFFLFIFGLYVVDKVIETLKSQSQLLTMDSRWNLLACFVDYFDCQLVSLAHMSTPWTLPNFWSSCGDLVFLTTEYIYSCETKRTVEINGLINYFWFFAST